MVLVFHHAIIRLKQKTHWTSIVTWQCISRGWTIAKNDVRGSYKRATSANLGHVDLSICRASLSGELSAIPLESLDSPSISQDLFVMVNFRSFSASLALASLALAHPGEDHTSEQVKRELIARNAAHNKMTRALGSCSKSPAFLARGERAIARRAETAKTLREKRGIEHKSIYGKRDQDALAQWAGTSHNLTDKGYTLDTPESTLFTGNATCALVEETTVGPYYVAGELLRTDITEGQQGVPLHLDIQFVDVSDCSAVSDIIIDIWHCNATGVYSGVSATGQGGLNSTFGRGAQISDEDGVAQFDTVFPGHYTGRVTHIHVLSTKDANVLSNNTYEGGVATHIGQLFFDPTLVSSVENTAPYTSNEQSFTDILDDSIAAGEATSDYDIFTDYALLGDSPSDGVLAWITVGIDSSANHTDQAKAAAHYYETGGVSTGLLSGGGPGGPGGPGGNSTVPGNSTSTATAGSTATSAGAASSSVVTSGATRRVAPFLSFFQIKLTSRLMLAY
ncbi:Intradiol ring-cleavage dioxygenase [Xylariales sp. AK1849]|nr:Intradiol ring-cleavage dioxygenase [Xylariales sp. AK1849]